MKNFIVCFGAHESHTHTLSSWFFSSITAFLWTYTQTVVLRKMPCILSPQFPTCWLVAKREYLWPISLVFYLIDPQVPGKSNVWDDSLLSQPGVETTHQTDLSTRHFWQNASVHRVLLSWWALKRQLEGKWMESHLGVQAQELGLFFPGVSGLGQFCEKSLGEDTVVDLLLESGNRFMSIFTFSCLSLSFRCCACACLLFFFFNSSI